MMYILYMVYGTVEWESFKRENFRALVEKWDFVENTYVDCSSYCTLSLQTIAEKTFICRHKTAKITKVFSLKSFRLTHECNARETQE